MHVNRGNWVCPLIAAIAIVVALFRACSTIGVFNDTVDEPFHIGAAVTLLEAGRLVHGTETPPLPRLVQGGALKLAGVHTKSIVPDRTIRDNKHAFTIGGEL